MKTVEKFGEFGGFHTRYLEAGDATSPVVLLLHDGAWGGCSSVTWGRSMQYFAERFRVIAPDMLGFGGSDKAVYFDRAPYEPRIAHLEAVVDALAPGELLHVVGTSFGGSVALRWLASGARFRSVTSLAGSGGPWRTRESIEGLRDWDGTRADMERLLALLVDRGAGFDALVDERMSWASVPGHYRALVSAGLPLPESLRRAREADAWPQQLASTTAPVHLIAGSRDTLLEPQWTQHVTAARPDIKATVLDEARHSPNLDDPRGVAHVIIDFLNAVR